MTDRSVTAGPLTAGAREAGAREAGVLAGGSGAGGARIGVLPTLVANQIAAGEVVERPASVVKELVENAIDAGATRITVEVERGGTELIRVTDNGCGIHRDDMLLAVAPHATSKVRVSDDLECVPTLGFRGEALASIASVSRFSIVSRRADSDSAWCLAGDGAHFPSSEAGGVVPASLAVGTVVVVRNLFFNTPARRKFLRTEQTERTRCLDVVRVLALPHHMIGFRVVSDGRVALDLLPSESPRGRTLELLGKELEGELIEVTPSEESGRPVRVWGLIGKPSLARANASEQYLYVNGRAVRDRTIQHALREGYRGYLEVGRHPTAVLMLSLDPSGVDVNVHPSKAEVRFRDSSAVYSCVIGAVREALSASDLTPEARFGARDDGANAAAGGYGRGVLPAAGTQDARDFARYFTRTVPSQTGGSLSFDAIRRAMESVASRPDDQPRTHEGANSEGAPGRAATGAFNAHDDAVGGAGEMASEPRLATPRVLPRVMQVHSTYLVTQDPDGLVIIDQHALHERVMFEELLARVSQGSLESQRFIAPLVINVKPSLLDRLDEFAPLFERLGVEAHRVAPDALALGAFPSLLLERGVEPEEMIADLFTRAEGADFAPGGEAALRDVLDMMACKAAVKAGDRLSEGEMLRLVELRDLVERASNCPHGRPTSVRLSAGMLDRLFHRR